MTNRLATIVELGKERSLRWLRGTVVLFGLLTLPAECAPAPPAALQNERPALTLLEAVRTTLAQDPAIRLQEKEVQYHRGLVQEAQGRFDSRLSSSVSRGLEQSGIRSSTNALNPDGFQRLTVNRTTVRAGVDKLLRSGVEVSPGVQVTRADDNLSGFDPENRAEVNFTVRVPLGRGRGSKDAAAEETAARITHEAARLELRNVIAARVLNTAVNYWNYLTATRRLQVLVQSEEQARELATNTMGLVRAGEVPPAETNQLTANLSDKIAGRIATEQELFEARQTLGLAMGLPAEQLAGLPPPGDGFPPANAGIAKLSAQPLIEAALSARADLQSARLREHSAITLRNAAQHRLKPKVDLLLQVGYGGVAGGGEFHQYARSFYDNVEGVNAFAGVSLNWPPANNEARGVLLQQESLYQQAVIRADDLSRNIVSSVSVAVERLRNVVQELKRTESAVADYETAVRSEQSKRQLGLSTFVNVLVLEDRLISASLAHLAAQYQHAAALARLRYDTGQLVSGDAATGSFRLEQLLTVPAPVPPGTSRTKP